MKFHGGGNFENVLLLWTARVIFKFYGGWNCLEEVSCGVAQALALNFQFLKEVSQNFFVFDVVNFENEEVSQTCCVFDVVKFNN